MALVETEQIELGVIGHPRLPEHQTTLADHLEEEPALLVKLRGVEIVAVEGDFEGLQETLGDLLVGTVAAGVGEFVEAMDPPVRRKTDEDTEDDFRSVPERFVQDADAGEIEEADQEAEFRGRGDEGAKA